MKTILLFVVLFILFMLPIPCFADTGTGVSLPLTVTVTDGGGVVGSGAWFASRVVPYLPPDWSSIFPSMNQPQSSATGDTRPVQTNPPIPIPTIAKTVATPSESTTPVYTPVETTPAMDKAVWAGILFWAIIIGLVVWGLSWVVDKKREKKVN